MSFPWQSYMSGRSQDREIRKFLDTLSTTAVSFASMSGTPSPPLISKARVPVGGFTRSFEGVGFEGRVDRAGGKVDIPVNGLYQVSGTIAGTVKGFTAPSEILLYVRIADQTDYGPIAAYPLTPNRASNPIALPFSLLDDLIGGESISLQIEASEDINEILTPIYASFQVSKRAET